MDDDGWCMRCGEEFHLDDTGGYNPPCRCKMNCRGCCAEQCEACPTCQGDGCEICQDAPQNEGAP